MEGKPMESIDLARVHKWLNQASLALKTRRPDNPQKVIAILQQALLELIKRDLRAWGLDTRHFSKVGQMVAVMAVYAQREPLFHSYLQMMALWVVLEKRLSFQGHETGWPTWRRDARLLVARLQRYIDKYPMDSNPTCVSA